MKILVIHATAGVGHQKAAEAIYQRFDDMPEHEAVIVDALDYTHPWFKASYVGTYSFMATKMPWIWARLFDLLDIPSIQPCIRWIRRLYNGLNTRRLVHFIQQEQFDWVITTHFLATEVCNDLRRKRKMAGRVLTMVTDYDAHHIWYGDSIDQYCVPSPQAEATLVGMGVPAERVLMTGMPTDRKFIQQKSREELSASLGIDPQRFTLLITSSSFGSGPIEETVKALGDYQLLVICGKNDTLYDRLKPRENEHIKIYRFVDNMPAMMAVADAIITKAGGLTVSESLVMGLPMLFFTKIPGQEEHNIRIMEEAGAGFRAFSVDQIKSYVDQWSTSSDVLADIRSRVRAIGKPDAAELIIAQIQ